MRWKRVHNAGEESTRTIERIRSQDEVFFKNKRPVASGAFVRQVAGSVDSPENHLQEPRGGVGGSAQVCKRISRGWT